MKLLVFLILNYGFLHCQTTISRYSDTINTNSVSVSFADSLFSYISSNLAILEYSDCNNCPLRAHVMTFIISKTYPEVKTAKAWLFADCKRSSRKEFYMTHKKEFLSGINGCPQWGFHVAPVLIFAKDTIVIDPSTQKKAVTLSKWVADISANTQSFLIIKSNSYYSYPEDEFDLFDDSEPLWKKRHVFSSLENEIDFLAEKLTKAYHTIFDPVKFYNYKISISKLISLK